MERCIKISVSIFVLSILVSGATLRLQALPPTAFEVQNPKTVTFEGRRSLGLLHANGLDAVMKMASEEILGLLKAAKEGDERAQAVLHELAVPFWTTVAVAMIVAWLFLAAAMVLSVSLSTPSSS